MKKTILLLLLSAVISLTDAQVSIGYYLPEDIGYNAAIPTPKQFFGHEVGEWHLTHDKLFFYMLELARVSDRAYWEEYGKSYEGRHLGQLIISSSENIKNIEQLRIQHIALSDPGISDRQSIKDMPLVVKLGYGVHGNESSAQNASALVAYYLVAGEGQKIENLLKNNIILIDPSMNPDGMQRHSTWVNSMRSLNDNPDPASMEFSEPWPGGRSNHYWFDLNRDYYSLQLPETRGRIEAFFRWRPNINTDHHEQGSGATFFYMPGIQSRNNPLTPAENQQLTAEIGKYHEKYLNEIGSLYFTEEGYDDFFIGKGSSWPDLHGSVGILFEQAGVRGHLRETPGFLLSFPYAIRNQVTVSLSTLEASVEMREKLLESQRKFYKDALTLAEKYPVKAFAFSEKYDQGRLSEFIRILLDQQIRIYKAKKDIAAFRAEETYVVPLKQNEYRFIRSLFEPVREFTDSSFYDISTWVLPMSFNIRYTSVTSPMDFEGLAGEEIRTAPAAEGKILGPDDPYAYLFEWNEYLSPRALYALQDAGVVTRIAKKEFAFNGSSFRHNFSYGTILIPVSLQSMDKAELRKLISEISKDCGIKFYGMSTGFTESGMDLGSGSFAVIAKPSVLMIAGDGISSTDAGEIWHMLDTRFKIPVTIASTSRIGTTNLDKYNVLIVTGSPDVSASAIENIKTWNQKGGVIIATEGGNNWLAKNKFAEIEFVPSEQTNLKTGIYADRSANSQARTIPGTIFQTKLDLTHPVCYGYTRDMLPVFKSGEMVAKSDQNIYNNPVVYTNDPLMSGYCTKDNLKRIKGSPFVSIHGAGVISIYDNPNFRAVWYGTNKIFINAIFFGGII
ncbi:MAG: hypothetical protein MUF36_00870 [Bacteroidales bacterium]|nr:hypothetical protein [Bacteroidales bacterium]